jgi:hypothetical protein
MALTKADGVSGIFTVISTSFVGFNELPDLREESNPPNLCEGAQSRDEVGEVLQHLAALRTGKQMRGSDAHVLHFAVVVLSECVSERDIECGLCRAVFE